MDTARPAELTIRAVGTGMLLGALLTPCNIYSGFKIGWSFNMSIAAGLLGFGLWSVARRATGTAPWHIGENNINQTAASSAASIVSGGLVAPIPAWTMLTGKSLAWPLLSLWVFAVSVLGVVVAAGLRNQMLLGEKLRFPAGVATAATLREIHGHGLEAMRRLALLLGAAALSGAVKLAGELAGALPRLALPLAAPLAALSRGTGTAAPTAANLGFVLDPSLLMVGFGAIVGLRVAVSMFLGAVLAWAVLAPIALSRGWTQPGAADPTTAWFAPLVEWLLWPGVTLMVVAALTAFAFPLVRLIRRRGVAAGHGAPPAVPPRALFAGFAVALVLAAALQTGLFEIGLWQAMLAVLLSFVLAVIAGRVTGETGITPIGAMGKVTQLTYGVVTPGDVTANLMSANVTGGAAGQCADLLDDLKTGLIIGVNPGFQVVAQLFGVMTGALVGTLAYLVLIPDPAGMLITPEWPAPAVATWKAVAEVLAEGLSAIPPSARAAMVIAAAAGLALGCAERLLPGRAARFLPSAPAFGLAFVIPAWNSISMFIGALAAAIIWRLAPEWAERRLIVVAAGLVAGEGLAGVGVAAVSLAG